MFIHMQICKPMALLKAGCQVLSAECSTRQNLESPLKLNLRKIDVEL